MTGNTKVQRNAGKYEETQWNGKESAELSWHTHGTLKEMWWNETKYEDM